MLKDVNVSFEKDQINHLLGDNETLNPVFARVCGVLPYEGEIIGSEKPLVAIGSYTNLPSDLYKKRYYGDM